MIDRVLTSAWILAPVLLAACAMGSGAPDEPPHDSYQDGVGHAEGKSTPFLCRDPDSGDRVSCPTDGRPEDADLSCDASGCRGSFEYDAEIWDSRALTGSGGPACDHCHGQFWSTEM